MSHIQAAVASTAVVAELTANPDGTPAPNAVIVNKLWGDAPADGTIEVLNLTGARGFTGSGQYLLYLGSHQGVWLVVGQQRSPGNDLTGVGAPLIYPWTDDVREQAEKLKPPSH